MYQQCVLGLAWSLLGAGVLESTGRCGDGREVLWTRMASMAAGLVLETVGRCGDTESTLTYSGVVQCNVLCG